MTTIAANREMMACDSQCQSGNLCSAVDKMFRLPNGALIGAAGELEICMLFVDWYKNGCDETPGMWDTSASFSGLVLTPKGKLIEFGPRLVPQVIKEKFHAVGSGCELAIGAMEAGADPIQAVKIACKRDSGTGGRVHYKRISGA